MSARVVLILIGITSLFGCAAADATPMVRAKAATDFVCEESAVTVSRSPNGAYSAMGCGKHALYDSFCEGSSCTIRRRGSP